MVKFKEITVCFDMYGCPNRCKHCWLGASSNGSMTAAEIEASAKEFRPFTDCLEVFDWYREPDFSDQYKELYELCRRLSDKRTEHFELVSFWRLVRDKDYVKWLASLGLKKAQLTFFGGEDTTDFYVGRKGAYRELLRAIEILIENKISPRIQTFVNKNNIGELENVSKLIEELKLEERCVSFGGEFSFFLHQGSCDGENEKLYNIRITPDDLEKIPEALRAYTQRHFGCDSIAEVFGKTERSLCEELSGDTSTRCYVNDSPVFYINGNFDVYPNITAPSPHWCLGNLKKDGAEAVLENYAESGSTAQRVRMTVPLGEIVKRQGDITSRRLFSKSDYIVFLLNKYCRDL